jgi:spermidine synthase
MSNGSLRRLIFHGPSADGDTLLRFREPRNSIPDKLFARLVDGSYGKPFMVEDREFRAMCFALDGSTQSEMRLDNPHTLVSEYTRKMMGFLLFQRRPPEVLIIGLGGGSLVKYCHKHLPMTHITAIEIDNEVIALREHFHVPPDDSRLKIINDDGARHVMKMVDANQYADVMLVDAYDRRGVAEAVVEHAFLENSRRALSPRGVFVMNLAEDTYLRNRHIESIRLVFGDPVIAIAMKDTANVVVFAGGALRDRGKLTMARRDSRRIQVALGLHFPTLLRRTTEFHRAVTLKRLAARDHGGNYEDFR